MPPFTPRLALFRVFILPLLPPSPPSLTLHRSASKYAEKLARRAAEGQLPSKLRPPPTLKTANAPRFPRDEEIHSVYIGLVDRQGEYHDSVRLRDVLRGLDRVSEHLVMVQEPEPGTMDLPTCRIYTKTELREKELGRLEAAKRQAKTQRSGKKIEFGWAIAPADLEMRIRQFIGFLKEGRKVEVLLARKRGARRVDLEECEGLIGRLRGEARGAGAREEKNPDGKLGVHYLMFFEGREAKEEKGRGKEAMVGEDADSVKQELPPAI
ncbi:hypothetical protein EJ06DRAFT_514608 [Trichodelitschia bisporula]|uniref:Translation initiation factor IF-3 n=1 Tax=Trichodelitschia bisporula TaxID=703511 RepID=A0A6G1HPV7_9PEZI|nr:hypothetical protein EJ06DRAFT_514608 [Trichodelitschia bisporula]